MKYTLHAMPRQLPLLALTAGAILALAGCATCTTTRLVRGFRDDYLEAEPGKDLIIPEDLTGVRITDAWPIPEIASEPSTRMFPTAAPRPEMLVARDLDLVEDSKARA